MKELPPVTDCPACRPLPPEVSTKYCPTHLDQMFLDLLAKQLVKKEVLNQTQAEIAFSPIRRYLQLIRGGVPNDRTRRDSQSS